MIFRARATRGLRRMGRIAWSSSCSRNAHDKNVLVRRAQSRIYQATLENETEIGITRAVEDQSAPIPGERGVGSEGRGRSGPVPFSLAERARLESARLGQERVSARSGLGG
jgi:hypothetical protein